MRLFGAVFLAICVLAIAAQSSQAAIVSVAFNHLNADAREGFPLPYTFAQDASTALDRSNTITATVGPNTSSTTLNWSTSSTTYAKFSFDFEHTRGGLQDSFARTNNNSLFFTVNSNTTYSISGIYELTGSQFVFGETYLRDTEGPYLFRDFNYSYNTINEKFVLGVANDGDTGNSTIGSLNGSLIAGHSYELYFSNEILANTTTGSAASAVGSLTLEIGTAPATVPEPATLTMWGLGAFGCAAAAYRRKREQAA